ncbi:MAG: cytidylate kinase-like family protein [Acidobacteria bacterium]|jgi:cytidylate kinase|nr:cytidylate kinase-like family protein [Acidobacteriota bacterium]
MFRIITVEREFGSGGGEIAAALAARLGWKLWDHALTEEIAKIANVDPRVVQSCDEHVDSSFRRLSKVFLRGSMERSMPLAGSAGFDADTMVSLVQQVINRAADGGNCVIVGRGAPYFLRERSGVFHVFTYASRIEKLRRLKSLGKSEKEAEELIDSVDRDRIEFIKHYFHADWPTRYLYHLMINTAVGNENVMATVLETMHRLEREPVVI